MHRVTTQRAAERIAAGFSLIPERIRERLEDTHFLTSDPVAAGLHSYEVASADGRSFRSTPHAAWPIHIERPLAERHATVVIPRHHEDQQWGVATVVHELAHMLHWQLELVDFEIAPVTDYAERDHYEAFAEAFCAWVLAPGYRDAGATDILHASGKRAIALFEQLACG